MAETAKRFPVAARFLGLLEWIADWFLYGFDRLALLRLIIQSTIAISLIGGVIALLFEFTDREEERVLRAWKVLADGAGAQANVGQKDAVTFLREKGKSLAKVRLPRTALDGVDLAGVDLSGAELINTNLTGANLSRCSLSEADLGGPI